MRHISWRDVVATVAVATATVGYLLWATDTAMTSWSARAAAVGVLVLGLVAGASEADRIAADYGAENHDRGPMVYVVWESILVALVLVSAVVAIAVSSAAWLGLLVLALVTLWISVTARAVAMAAGHEPLGH